MSSAAKNRTAKYRAVKNRRPIHKKVLLHPLGIFGLLCLGVLLAASTLNAGAANVTINGELPAPPLTAPATISQPLDGESVTTTTPIIVKGTCPNASYVELLRNGYLSGSAVCQPDGTFQIETDLTPGSNVLSVQDYNETNQAGPISTGLTVTYQPPPSSNGAVTHQPSGGSTTEAANSPSPAASSLFNHSGFGPLLLKTNYTYRAFTTNGKYTWTMDLTGGTPPYTVTVDWGDGTTSNLYLKTDPTFTIQHQYTKDGTYNILVTCIDSLGEKVVLQLSTVINNPQTSVGQGLQQPSGTTPGQASGLSVLGVLQSIHNYLWIMWPAYGIIVLMAMSFWLGERRELQMLAVTTKHHPRKR